MTATGAERADHWSKPQGGFRLDWTPSSADAVTLQGDAYQAARRRRAPDARHSTAATSLGRWNHAWTDGSSLQVQAYYDRASAGHRQGGGSFWVDTYDLDIQHSFDWGGAKAGRRGGGVRLDAYDIIGPLGASISAVRPRRSSCPTCSPRTPSRSPRRLKLILGLKLEDDPYSGVRAAARRTPVLEAQR